jgi:hypothetical protein
MLVDVHRGDFTAATRTGALARASRLVRACQNELLFELRDSFFEFLRLCLQ